MLLLKLGRTKAHVVLGKARAVELGGPGELECVHDCLALGLDRLAERAAWHERFAEKGAHGDVDGAEEELEVWTAADLDEWEVGHCLLTGFVLCVGGVKNCCVAYINVRNIKACMLHKQHAEGVPTTETIFETIGRGAVSYVTPY